MSTLPEIKKLMLADLARSGLTAQDAKVLCLEPWLHEQGKQQVPAYRIPYFDFDGEVTGFYRLKLLAPCKDENGDLRRYAQELDSPNHLYIPPLGGADWRAIMNDPAAEVWLVEGEKKAAAMCKAGLPTVGIGGVDNFIKSKGDKTPVDGLAELARGGRVVNILFDSDA